MVLCFASKGGEGGERESREVGMCGGGARKVTLLAVGNENQSKGSYLRHVNIMEKDGKGAKGTFFKFIF